MNEYILELKKLNKKALKNGDIPVSAIIIKDNKIIATEYNKKYKNNDPFAHAEILVIKKAAKKLKRSNLSDCILIVSLEPCKMCKEVIKEAKIKNVYYLVDNNKIINNKVLYKKIETEDNYFVNEIKEFFFNKR